MKLSQIQTIAIIVFLVVLVGVVGYLIFANKHPAPKTYLNSRYGLWFSYPDNYQLTETAATGTQTGMVVTLKKRGLLSAEKEHILIGMYDATTTPKESTLLSWIKNSPYSYFDHAYQDTPGITTMGNQPAYLYTWHDKDYGTTVVTMYNKNVIMFTVTYAAQTELENREVFTDIIASVRFLNATTTQTSVKPKNALVKPLDYSYIYVKK